MGKIEWTPQAVEDVHSIYQYIGRDSSTTAKLIVERIYHRVSQLYQFPESGRKVPEINRPNIRELIYRNYRIIYSLPNKDHIHILTVFHSSRTLDDTAFPE